jgi:hypothetical protein
LDRKLALRRSRLRLSRPCRDHEVGAIVVAGIGDPGPASVSISVERCCSRLAVSRRSGRCHSAAERSRAALFSETSPRNFRRKKRRSASAGDGLFFVKNAIKRLQLYRPIC